jgi:hypothetical protein
MQASVCSYFRIIDVEVSTRPAFDKDRIHTNIGCEIKDLTLCRITHINRYRQGSIAEGAIRDRLHSKLKCPRYKLRTG